MKHIFIMLLFGLTASLALAAWFEGGGLAGSTVLQWKAAASQNRLATSAAWANATPYIAGRLDRWKRPEPYMQHARRLMGCIDFQVNPNNHYDQQPVANFAQTCMKSFGWMKAR